MGGVQTTSTERGERTLTSTSGTAGTPINTYIHEVKRERDDRERS